jgi:hypothetical protein
MRIFTFLIICVAALISGCQHEALVSRVDRLDGLTEAQVIARFGMPTRQFEFPMSKAQDEFRAALQQYHLASESRCSDSRVDMGAVEGICHSLVARDQQHLESF